MLSDNDIEFLVSQCQFHIWYPILKNYSIKSEHVILEKHFLEYLIEDSVFTDDRLNFGKVAQANSDSEDEVEWDEEVSETKARVFPEMEGTVNRVIARLSGAVFPKLNWSSPRDAVWATLGNTLRCRNALEVIFLLKCSDYIAYDLCSPYGDRKKSSAGSDLYCHDDLKYYLVLKKWEDIFPSSEHRLFVKAHHLVAVSQRHIHTHFPALADTKRDLWPVFSNFCERVGDMLRRSGKFLLKDYIIDVFIQQVGNSVILVDIGPWHAYTDSLLFSWDELNELSQFSDQPVLDDVFRLAPPHVTNQVNPIRVTHGVPLDFVHLSMGEDPYKFIDFMNLKLQDQGETSDSD